MQRGTEQLKEADGSAKREGEHMEAESKGEMRHRRDAGKKEEENSCRGGRKMMLAKNGVGELTVHILVQI